MSGTSGTIFAQFGVNLRAARNAVGLNQFQVAERMRACGFSWDQAAVNVAEHGARRVRLDEAEALSEIVRVPLDRMLTEPAARVARIAKENMRGGAMA